MRNRLWVLITVVALAGCTALWQDLGGRRQRQGVSSSLVDFLYPRGEVPPEQDKVIPNLAVPLRVGLAFVPSRDPMTPGLSEAAKSELLGKVKSAFADREFIREITIIPDTYLRSRQGFETVDQVARLYGLDVIALVSYDQVVHAEDTRASILYWTIVGAYFIKGSKNDVQTFVDAAIFDVKTRKLLFRAPGIDRIEARTTLVESPEEIRKARERGFANAMADMTANLGRELEAFRARIKTDQSVTVTQRSGASRGGGGALGLPPLGILLVVLAAARITRRGRR
jgi:rhombotail lipoprotein